MNKKFFIAWLVMFIVYMAGGFVVHGTLLKEDYMGLPSLFRSEEESMPYFHLMIIAHVLMAGAFTWIYARGVENKPWLGQGLRFGLAVALLAVVPYLPDLFHRAADTVPVSRSSRSCSTRS